MTGEIKSYFIKKSFTKIFILGCLIFFFGNSSAKGEENNIIIEKNLFSPTRQKWVTSQKAPPKKEINKALLPELCGTIVTDSKKVALFRVSQSAQPAQPAPPVKFSKGRKVSKANAVTTVSPRTFTTRSYCVGDTINGCMLAKIRENRVRLECGGEKVRLYLH